MTLRRQSREMTKALLQRAGYRLQRDRYKPLLAYQIFGWMTVSECQKLHALALTTSGPILEIGHFVGKSTACLCEGIRDSGRSRRFDSYDLGYLSADDLAGYYETIFERKLAIPAEYERYVYRHQVTSSEIARRNLRRLGLEQYVRLISGNFIDSRPSGYDLIFCDALHSPKEIAHNLPPIVARSNKGCLWAFHDMEDRNVCAVLAQVDARLIERVDTLGLFVYAGG